MADKEQKPKDELSTEDVPLKKRGGDAAGDAEGADTPGQDEPGDEAGGATGQGPV